MFRRQHNDDRGTGQRFGEVADRAGQHGDTAQQRELLGDASAAAFAGTAGHDDDPDGCHGAIF